MKINRDVTRFLWTFAAVAVLILVFSTADVGSRQPKLLCGMSTNCIIPRNFKLYD